MTTKSSPFILWIGIISFGLLNLANAAPWRSQTIPEKVPPSIVKSDRSSWGVKNGFFGGVGIGAGMMLFSTPNMNNNYKGGNIGSGGICGSDDSGNANQCYASDSALALDYSAKLGVQLYFTPYIGTRAYVSYVGGTGFPGTGAGGSSYNLYYLNHSVDFNLDFLLEIAQTYRSSFGLILGVNAGYNMFFRNISSGSMVVSVGETLTLAGRESIDSYMLGLNFGVGLTMFKRHRFDVMAKIPITPLDSDANVAGVYVGNLYINNDTNSSNWTKEIYYRYISVNVSYSFVY